MGHNDLFKYLFSCVRFQKPNSANVLFCSGIWQSGHSLAAAFHFGNGCHVAKDGLTFSMLKTEMKMLSVGY